MLYPAELTGQAPQRSGRRWRSSARRAPQLAQEHRRMEAGIGERRNARPQSARTRHRPQSAVEVSGRRSSSLANPWRARAVACHARPVHHGERVGVTSIFLQRPPIVTRRTLTAIGSSSLLREHDSTPSTVTRGRVRRACGCPSVGGHRILPTGGRERLPTDGHSTAVSDRQADVRERGIPALISRGVGVSVRYGARCGGHDLQQFAGHQSPECPLGTRVPADLDAVRSPVPLRFVGVVVVAEFFAGQEVASSVNLS